MKRLLILLLLCAGTSEAQTTVNLTVQDTGSVFWSGPWTATLRPPPGFPPNTTMSIIAGGGSTAPQSGTLSGSGTASVSLPANNNIVPLGSLWFFQVCFGTSGNCFGQLVNVGTGSPQAVAITPPAPGAPPSSGGGGGGSPNFPINSQTVSYQTLASDFSSAKLITMNSASATTVTLLAVAPAVGQNIQVQNIGTANVTIANNTRNIDGVAANLTLQPNSGVFISSDGTNYFTNRGGLGSLSSTPSASQATAPVGGASNIGTYFTAGSGQGIYFVLRTSSLVNQLIALDGNGGGNDLLEFATADLRELTVPVGTATLGRLYDDPTTHTISHNSNNNGVMAFSGAWVNTNLTPVTVAANVATDQSLMTVSVPAGTLNRVGRSLRFYGSGVYSTPAASTSVITIKVKYGALTLVTWATTALASVTATNNQFNISGMLSVQTAGASGAFEPHGVLTIDLGTGNLVADTSFADVNSATVGTVDVTAAQSLLVTIAFSNASASNSTTQRQMVSETVN